MPISLHNEHDNVYRLEVRGTLSKREMDQCQDVLIEEMGRIGPVRLLFVLEDFDGWESNEDWNDLTFYVKHGDAIERIAIVGTERWRSLALMFAAADLRKAPVEYFTENDVAGARAWLSA